MSSRELVIPALVARHAEDAAFYWSQQDAGATAFLVRPARLFHFDDLLDAHLEGLAVAGPEGVTLAYTQDLPDGAMLNTAETVTPPSWVNFKALPVRFSRICLMRRSSR